MGMSDMLARAQAAQSMMKPDGGPSPDAEAGLPPDAAGLEAPPVDLEGALSSVESATETMNPDDAEEIRTHVNAIREIAARSEEGQEPPPTGNEPPTPLEDQAGSPPSLPPPGM